MSNKKGKSKSGKGVSDFESNQDKRELSEQFRGSLSSKHIVLVTLKDKQPRRARIISYNTQMELTDASYDYYITFIEMDRRNDCWVKRCDMQMTDEIIVEQKHHKSQGQKKIEMEENHEHEGCKEEDIERHREATKIKTIEKIKIGDILCNTWYYSPYPKGYHNIEVLFICEFCLNFFLSESEKQRHDQKCQLTHPPGDEIYRDDTNKLSVFEIDGKKNRIYGENLAYLAKLFLDHKTLWRDMEPFMFYVLCENDDRGSHIVGYFSKEKYQEDEKGVKQRADDFNLSCILVLPCHQRKGYGKFLISFSYELSLIEGRLGTPERPLSDLESMNCQFIICTDARKLKEVYDECGKPGVPIISQDIRWVPMRPKWDNYDDLLFPSYNPCFHLTKICSSPEVENVYEYLSYSDNVITLKKIPRLLEAASPSTESPSCPNNDQISSSTSPTSNEPMNVFCH